MLTKDVNRLWESVGSFWDKFENRDIISTLWQSYLEISEHVTQRNFAIRLSKSMPYMPSLLNERFGTFNIVFSGLNKEDVNIYKDPAGKYFLQTHYSHIASMPYLKNLSVSDESDYVENSQFNISNYNSIELKRDQIKMDPANSGLVDYVELHADKFYRHNPVLWEVWGRSVNLDVSSITQKKYLPFKKSIDTMDSTEALKLTADHYKHLIWGLATYQSQGATMTNLKGAAHITAGLPFSYVAGECSDITTVSGYNFVTITGLEGNHTYDIPDHLGVTATAGSAVKKFEPLTRGIEIYDYMNNIEEVKVFTDYPGNGSAGNFNFTKTLVTDSKVNVTFDRNEVTIPAYSYAPFTEKGADKTRVSTNYAHTFEAGYALSIAGASSTYNGNWDVESPVYDDIYAGHSFIIDIPFVAGSDYHGGTISYNSGAYSGMHMYYGPELIANGNFQDNTSWYTGIGWAINSTLQVLQCSGIHPDDTYSSQTSVTDFSGSGSEYWVQYTIKNSLGNSTDGNVWVSMGTNAGIKRYVDGTYAEVLEAKGNNNFYIYADEKFKGYIDDVSVRIVTVVSGATKGEIEGDFYPILESGSMDLDDTAAIIRTSPGKSQSLKIYDTSIAGIATQSNITMNKGAHYRLRGSFYNESAEPLHAELSVTKKGIEKIKNGFFARSVETDTNWVAVDAGSATQTLSMNGPFMKIENSVDASGADYVLQSNILTQLQGKSYALHIGVESFEGASWFFNHNGQTDSFGSTQNTSDDITAYFDWDETYNLDLRIGVNSGTLKIKKVSIKELGSGYGTYGLEQSHQQLYFTGIKAQLEPYNLSLKPGEWKDLDIHFNNTAEMLVIMN